MLLFGHILQKHRIHPHRGLRFTTRVEARYQRRLHKAFVSVHDAPLGVTQLVVRHMKRVVFLFIPLRVSNFPRMDPANSNK